jgi:hypothetical protein
MWCSKAFSYLGGLPLGGRVPPEESGRVTGRLDASRRGTQNLVDSYTEVVPKALEVLPSETRHRI